MKTIVWDVDDVLNELMKNWFELAWLPYHPYCGISYGDISENPPHNILKISKKEYLDSLDQFRQSDFATNMEPVPSLKMWFDNHGKYFHHIALTATPLKTASKSAEWVIRHFGTWIRSFNFVPSKREQEQLPIFHPTKEYFLRWWGKADIVIDDNPVNLAEAETLGIQTVCMPQPWNHSRFTPEEALEILTSLR